jgi:hypothetical protein
MFGIAAVCVLAAPSAHADPASSAWARLRACESGGNYAVAAANGHYGAYQFDLGTWRSVGGNGDPSAASPAEQDYRALYLYRMRGWQPWACARSQGLPPDGDAATGHVPSYADAARIAGNAWNGPGSQPGHGGPPGGAEPPWPGKVYNYGDCDPALRAWQLRMNVYGYSFEGTGCYFDKTKAAVLALQQANGIRTSGLLGPKTWHAAWEGTPPPKP